jgi:hypothetical protein
MVGDKSISGLASFELVARADMSTFNCNILQTTNDAAGIKFKRRIHPVTGRKLMSTSPNFNERHTRLLYWQVTTGLDAIDVSTA